MQDNEYFDVVRRIYIIFSLLRKSYVASRKYVHMVWDICLLCPKVWHIKKECNKIDTKINTCLICYFPRFIHLCEWEANVLYGCKDYNPDCKTRVIAITSLDWTCTNNKLFFQWLFRDERSNFGLWKGFVCDLGLMGSQIVFVDRGKLRLPGVGLCVFGLMSTFLYCPWRDSCHNIYNMLHPLLKKQKPTEYGRRILPYRILAIWRLHFSSKFTKNKTEKITKKAESFTWTRLSSINLYMSLHVSLAPDISLPTYWCPLLYKSWVPPV